MYLKKKICLISTLLILISIFGTAYAINYQNNTSQTINDTNNVELGCCSIVLQLEGNDSIMAFRRDSNLDADIHIEQINWHGMPVIKQYKTDNKYFCHVIITDNGWTIGLGGIDDGIDNQRCENITASMINENNTISKEGLKKIQEIKKPYGRGHVLIKAPNGNYGFATIDHIKTGNLKPGQYISMPNNYSCSRSGEISLSSTDKIEEMTQLARSDKYGEYRRDITIYEYHRNKTDAKTDIYISNEDGALIGQDYVDCADDVYINTTLIKENDIPIAPNYKSIGTMSFSGHNTITNTLLSDFLIPTSVAIIIFAGILFFVIFKCVKFIAKKKN